MRRKGRRAGGAPGGKGGERRARWDCMFAGWAGAGAVEREGGWGGGRIKDVSFERTIDTLANHRFCCDCQSVRSVLEMWGRYYGGGVC